MRNTFKIISLFAIIFIVGCASKIPSPSELKAELSGFELPKLPNEGKAIVYVVRPSSVGGLIRFNVFVDGKQPQSEMGYTRGKQYIYFNVDPGEHTILSKAENWAEQKISTKAGDIIFIQQDATMGIVLARNSLKELQPDHGKYRVKTLELGTIIKTE